MLELLLAASLGLAPAPATPVAATPDSIVVERLVPPKPRTVPMKKINGIAPGTLLTVVDSELKQDGFYKLSPAAIKSACGAEATAGLRLAVRVRDNATWRELEIPDKCDRGSPALQKQLAAISNASWEVLRGRTLPAKPKP